eukprot:ctg_953.g225
MQFGVVLGRAQKARILVAELADQRANRVVRAGAGGQREAGRRSALITPDLLARQAVHPAGGVVVGGDDGVDSLVPQRPVGHCVFGGGDDLDGQGGGEWEGDMGGGDAEDESDGGEEGIHGH